MRKKILAVFPLLTVIFIFLGLSIANRIATPPWQAELNQYLAYKTSPPAALPIAEHTLLASRPWRFRADISRAAYGDCFSYSVTNCYHPGQLPPSQPLPSPPEVVWCALLHSVTGQSENSWIVYIAFYQDLSNAGWIVHESARSLSDPRLADDLNTLGCRGLVNTTR